MEFTFRKKTKFHYLKVKNMQNDKMVEKTNKVIDADDLTIEVIKEPKTENIKDLQQLNKKLEHLKTRIDNMEPEVKIQKHIY
jgi:hypothetical protein